jgi:hypothetical protein
MNWFNWTPNANGDGFWDIVANASWKRPIGPVFNGKQYHDQLDLL